MKKNKGSDPAFSFLVTAEFNLLDCSGFLGGVEVIRDPLGEQGGHLVEILRLGKVVVGAGEDHEDVLAGEFLGQASALVERHVLVGVALDDERRCGNGLGRLVAAVTGAVLVESV